MSSTLQRHYKEQIRLHEDQLAGIKRQLFMSSMLRLFLFVALVAACYVFWGQTRYVVALCLLVAVLFLLLVSRHTDLQFKKYKTKALVDQNKTELEVLERRYGQLPNGKEFYDPGHFYSGDIDLFGQGSFFQYMNRTALSEGSERLAQLLNANEIGQIAQRQEAIKELAQLFSWRQEFLAIASLAKTETKTDTIVHWLKNYHPFMPQWLKHLPWLFSIGTCAVVLSYFMQWLPEAVLIYWVLVGLLIVGMFTKKITRLAAVTGNALSTFRQYQQLVALIEQTDFKSGLLRNQKQKLYSTGKSTSKVLQEFAKILAHLDRNNNIFYLVLGNGLFLHSLVTTAKMETWIKRHGQEVAIWFQTIAFFDAYSSLGNFAFNHPDYVYPELKEEDGIRATAAGHPLLDPKKCVANDYEIGQEQFLIITGANMAGKSTFLRTVALQIVMANIGLPVCASSFSYSPIKLITSMRTSDSLTDEASYFFAELQRLKFVVDEMEKERYFIILDEILKGTNSVDKAMGSKKFLERLVNSQSTGIIATHDLALCDVAKTNTQVKNHYFDAEIVNGELHFDYTIKEGICKNMNASFLLRKMGIVTD
jgi:hypothetical protein